MSAARWSSRVAFYLAGVGAAVGLGSIWRFPYLTGSLGGSAFVFVFLVAILAIATPLLVAEYMIGRSSRRNPAQAAGDIAMRFGYSRAWNAIGFLGLWTAILIMSYYTIIAGWVMAYIWKCGSGELTSLARSEVPGYFHAFLAQPLAIGGWHFAFILLVGLISAGGVSRGIEIATRIRAPGLMILLIILVSYALAKGDVQRGLSFAFAPDFAHLSGRVVLAAVGQAFFATGVGMGMMLAYGAYVPTEVSLLRSSLIVSSSILLVSLLATVMIFPLVFEYGLDPAQGPDLVFNVLLAVRCGGCAHLLRSPGPQGLGPLEQARVPVPSREGSQGRGGTHPPQRIDRAEHGHVGAQGGEPLEQKGVRSLRTQHLVRKVLDRPVTADEPRRALGADSGDAGISIRGVPDECEVIGNSRRLHAEFHLHPCSVPNDLGSPVDLHHALTHHTLREVLIGRPYAHFLHDGLCGRPCRRGGQRIVRLELDHRPDHDSQGAERLLQRLELGEQRGLDPLARLVPAPELVAKGFDDVIGGDPQMRGALFDHLQDPMQYTEHRTQGAILACEAAQPVEVTEQLVRTVDEVHDHRGIIAETRQRSI
jgi:hypothetical protein